MAEYGSAEAARRAGVDAEYLDRLVELRIVTPAAGERWSPGEIRKAQLVRTLEQAGIGLEPLGQAIGDGLLTLSFLDAPVYQRFATLSGETFRELSERTDLPLELLTAIREATGAPTPSADDRVREDELAIVPFVETELSMGFQPRSIEATLRVLGDSLRRVSDQESDAWRADVVNPMLARGATMNEQAAMSTAEPVTQLVRTMDEAVLAIWHAQQVHSWTANIIGLVEIALTDAGLFTKLERPPAICFLDLVGYTRLTHERGDEAAAELAESFSRLVTNTSLEHGGRPVKWLGDGVMVYFRDPGHGVIAALKMVDGAVSAGLPPAHVGLHAGPVLFQEGDYFGQTVNVASRIADYARPGEVLVTEEVVEAAGGAGADGAASFAEIGPVELKGLGGPVRLYAATRRD